jgi:DNA invertase Pin-like site-specific DNA recombinase
MLRPLTPVRTPNVKHEARGVVRAGQHGRTDAGKSNPRASASRQAAWLGRRGCYSDAGISGAKGRNGRPGLDYMLKDASRRKFDIVMAWAIDHLGRSLSDLLDTIQHLEACGVDLYLDQQAIDTTTPPWASSFSS